jgi:hypothetical protein
MRFMAAIPTGAASLLIAGFIVACDGGGSCADLAGGASAPCPEPVYGYARVNGTVLHADGAPAPSAEAFVDCQEVGRSGSLTDAEGRFAIFMEYFSGDTIARPLPPRGADGSFNLSCEANSTVTPGVVARESLTVHFTPTIQAIVPSTVELRAPAP